MRKTDQSLNIRRSRREMKRRWKRKRNKGLNRKNSMAWRLFKEGRKQLFKPGTKLIWPTCWRGWISSFRQGGF